MDILYSYTFRADSVNTAHRSTSVAQRVTALIRQLRESGLFSDFTEKEQWLCCSSCSGDLGNLGLSVGSRSNHGSKTGLLPTEDLHSLWR